jgi:hypothetical protein
MKDTELESLTDEVTSLISKRIPKGVSFAIVLVSDDDTGNGGLGARRIRLTEDSGEHWRLLLDCLDSCCSTIEEGYEIATSCN